MFLSFLCSLQKCARKEEVDSRDLDQRKTLQTLNVVKSTDENDEFEKQRTAAIAEVAKTKEVCKTSSWVCVFITCYTGHVIFKTILLATFANFAVSHINCIFVLLS